MGGRAHDGQDQADRKAEGLDPCAPVLLTAGELEQELRCAYLEGHMDARADATQWLAMCDASGRSLQSFQASRARRRVESLAQTRRRASEAAAGRATEEEEEE